MTENLPTTEVKSHVVQSSIFFNIAKFEHAQRVSKMLCASSMVPDHFKGTQNLGNCMIALNFADRLGLDPFMVMQNIYVVHGRPGMEAKLAIALVNNSGKFSPIQYRMTGTKDSDSWGCVAYAKNRETGEKCEGAEVTIKMSKDEGWYGKNGSKWKTMPELMLNYRAAMFFARKYCPEALMGFQIVEEIHDYVDAKPKENGTYTIDEEPPDTSEFDELAAEKTTYTGNESLDKFLSETAEANGTDIDRLKVEAAKHFDDFWYSFEKWEQKNTDPKKKTASKKSAAIKPLIDQLNKYAAENDEAFAAGKINAKIKKDIDNLTATEAQRWIDEIEAYIATQE